MGARGQRSKGRSQRGMSEDGGLKPGPSPLRRAPSSSGFLVTDTTFMTSRFPPWRIRATTCLCPTFTTFTPFTWDRQAGGGPFQVCPSQDSGGSTPPGCTGTRPHLDEEVSRAQPRPPGHTLHIHRLKVLERREGGRGRELLDGGLCCRGGQLGRGSTSVVQVQTVPHRHLPQVFTMLNQGQSRQGALGPPRVETRPRARPGGLPFHETHSSRDLGKQQTQGTTALYCDVPNQESSRSSRTRQGGARKREGRGQGRGQTSRDRGSGGGRGKGRGRGEAGRGAARRGRDKKHPKWGAAPASLTPQPPTHSRGHLLFITFGSAEHKTEALMVPFLQDSHLVVNDIITGGGKQGGIRRAPSESKHSWPG